MPEPIPVPPILPIIQPVSTEDDSAQILEEEDIKYDEGLTAAGAAALDAKKPKGEVGSTAGLTPTTIPVEDKTPVETHPSRARRNLIKSKDMA